MRNAKLLLIPITIVALLSGCGGGGGNGGGTIPVNPGGDGKNQAPSITSLSPQGTAGSPVKILTGGKQHLVAAATDPDKKDTLTYTWTVDKGQITGSGSDADFTAPATACTAIVTVSVSDGHNHTAKAQCCFAVGKPQDPPVDPPVTNDPPEITSVTADPESVTTGATSTITATVTDPDGDQLTYSWDVDGGTIQSNNGNSAVWTAPATAGSYTVTVYVSDGHNTAVSKSVAIGVDAPAEPPITTGLSATYIQNDGVMAHPDLSKGQFVLARVDQAINFDWERKAPDPLLITDTTNETACDYGVIWKGYIKCEAAGTYSFAAEFDDGFQLWISDDAGTMQTIIDAWTLGPKDKEQGTITLEGGKWYKLEAHYFADEDRSYVRLFWLPPDAAPDLTEWPVVPTDVFRIDE